MSERIFFSAVTKLYRATLEPDTFAVFLDEFSKVIGALGGHYYLWDEKLPGITFSATSHNYSIEMQAEPAEGMTSNNKSLRYSLTKEGEWLFNNRDLNKQYPEVSIRSEFLYVGDSYHATGYRTSNSTPVRSVVGFLRGPERGPMEDKELAWLRRLRPHFESSGRLHCEMLRLRLSANLQDQALNALDYPIIIAYKSGFIAYHNRAAEVWLADNPMFDIKSQRLSGHRALDQGKFERLLHNVFDKCISGVLPIPRTDGAKPYQMIAIPLNHQSRLGSGWQCPMALIVVSNPLSGSALTREQMQTLFGLTAAEARVALRLAEGKTLQEISDEHDVSSNTTRAQLKQVFIKTGSRRQAELVKIVNALPKT